MPVRKPSSCSFEEGSAANVLAGSAVRWPGRRFRKEAASVADQDTQGGELRCVENYMGGGYDDDATDQTGRQSACHGRPTGPGVQGHGRVGVEPRAGHVPMPGVGVLARTALGLAYESRCRGTGVDGDRDVSEAAGQGVRHVPSVLPEVCAGQTRPVAAEEVRRVGTAMPRAGCGSWWWSVASWSVAATAPARRPAATSRGSQRTPRGTPAAWASPRRRLTGRPARREMITPGNI